MKGTFFETLFFVLSAGAVFALLLSLQFEIPVVFVLMAAAWSICVIMGNCYIRLCAGIIGIAILGISAFISIYGESMKPGYYDTTDSWERRKRGAEWAHAHTNERAFSIGGVVLLAIGVTITAQRIQRQEFAKTLESSLSKNVTTKWSVNVKDIR